MNHVADFWVRNLILDVFRAVGSNIFGFIIYFAKFFVVLIKNYNKMIKYENDEINKMINYLLI